MSMLEKAARALYVARYGDDIKTWEELTDDWRGRLTADARAVLAAIREPDDATASRASDIAYEGENAMSGETCPVMRNHVRSYIDAILQEKTDE